MTTARAQLAGSLRATMVLTLLATSCVERQSASAVATDTTAELRCETQARNGGCAVYGPSIVELIANPLRYHGKVVRVIGFAHLEFEGNELYVSREDFLRGIMRNGLWLGTFADGVRPVEAGSGRYALVEGVFDAHNSGHMNSTSGTIERIRRFEVWPDRDSVERRRRAPRSPGPAR